MDENRRQDILYEVRDAVAVITANRPQAMNALDVPLAKALQGAVEAAERDPAVRAVAILGAGQHFMAGGDIRTFVASLDQPEVERTRLFSELIGAAHAAISSIHRMPKPVVAGVQGAVAGFGYSLMNACDLAVAADNAYLSLAYSRLGATPDGGSSYTLPRLVGRKRAAEIAMLSDRIDAARALELGLVNRIVPAPELAAETEALAMRLANGATGALGKTKALLNQSFARSLDEQLLAELQSFVSASQSDDFREGVNAFVGKRSPRFSGK